MHETLNENYGMKKNESGRERERERERERTVFAHIDIGKMNV